VGQGGGKESRACGGGSGKGGGEGGIKANVAECIDKLVARPAPLAARRLSCRNLKGASSSVGIDADSPSAKVVTF
jgi:hypothetical protein